MGVITATTTLNNKKTLQHQYSNHVKLEEYKTSQPVVHPVRFFKNLETQALSENHNNHNGKKLSWLRAEQLPEVSYTKTNKQTNKKLVQSFTFSFNLKF